MPSLLQNVRSNFAGFLAGKAFAAGAAVLLPRLLHVEKMGLYTSAWGMVAVVSVVSDMGLASYLTREVSRQRPLASAFFYRGLAMQGIQLALAAGVLAIVMSFGRGSGLSSSLVALAFIASALASMGNPFSATLQGLEQFKVTGIVTSMASLFNAIALGLALYLRPEPAMAFGALAVSGVLGVALWVAVMIRLDLLSAPPQKWRLWEIFRGALPFAMVSTVSQIYVRVDLMILTLMLGPQTLGQYGVAVVVVDRIVPMLSALAGPLYPRLSADFKSDSLQRALRYLSALCLPLGMGGCLLATPLMAWVFGAEFGEAGRAFRWLAWVPALIGMHGAMLHAMNALGKTKLIALVFLANLVLNVGLNIALIPRYGYEASAAISTLNEAVVLAAVSLILAKSGFELGLRRWLWPALPAAIGMGLLIALLPAPQGWQVPLWIGLGALAYALLLWALGFMGQDERMHLRRLLGREA
jgi:O-antigen/teichoic acid export membrane protein